METVHELVRYLRRVLDIPLYAAGKTSITVWTILYLILVIVLLFSVTERLKRWVVERLLAHSSVEVGVRHAIGSIVRYVVVTLGLLIVLQSVGINLSTLTVLAGALGIGIGFGLQNITNNLVSDIILLFERPIKIGDRIEVGDVHGDVVDIRPGRPRSSQTTTSPSLFRTQTSSHPV